MRKLITFTILIITVAILGLGLLNCEGTEESKVSYAIDIDPVFGGAKYNCKGCHTSASQSHLDLTTYDGLMDGESDNGPVVIVGDADNSLLYLKVSLVTPPVGDRMPFGGPYLTSTEMRLIRDWIDQGANDN